MAEISIQNYIALWISLTRDSAILKDIRTEITDIVINIRLLTNLILTLIEQKNDVTAKV